MFNDKTVLITGGTGSFGRKITKTILDRYSPRKIIIFSRDELSQYQMAQVFPKDKYSCMRYFIGDVREVDRLYEAFHNVDYVIHAAALKHVPICEYNPFEAIKTNVIGAQNVIRAAINQKVKKVIALSTDKAASPVNLYGATKLCSDKLFVASNSMSGEAGTVFSVVRYGNVMGSRGSVIPFFLDKRKEGVLPVTDERMTRFSITLQEAVDFVLESFSIMQGGEIFVPKLPSYRILDIAKAIGPNCKVDKVGIRPGEKLHETMITEDDSRNTLELDDRYVIEPPFDWWRSKKDCKPEGKNCPSGFVYSSGVNEHWLSVDQLVSLINDYCREYGMEPL